jgi:hypothetical protein
MDTTTEAARYLDPVHDQSDPKHPRIYQTELANGVIVVRVSDESVPAWTGQWPNTIPADAPGLSEYAIGELNRLLRAAGA